MRDVAGAFARRCSSAAEQGSHKPRVGGSIPPTATKNSITCEAGLPGASPAASISPTIQYQLPIVSTPPARHVLTSQGGQHHSSYFVLKTIVSVFCPLTAINTSSGSGPRVWIYIC